MTPEKRLMNQIRIRCGEKGWLALRTNVGRVQMKSGGWFDTGLPKGFPDLLVLTDNGEAIFVEVKIKPNKPSKEQVRFIERMKEMGFKAFVAYSVDDFENKLNS